MRLIGCLLVLACGCGDGAPVLTEPPVGLTVVTYNMYYGIAADLIPESTSVSGLQSSLTALLNAATLTDFRCRIRGAARSIVAEAPDVIGLQEAVLLAYTRDLEDRADDDVIVDFVTELVQAIEGLTGVRYRAFVRDNTVIQDRLPLLGGVRLIDRVAILVHPRFPAKLAGSLTYQALKPAADFARTGTGQVVRGVLHVQVPFTSGALDLYTTHLQSGSGDPFRPLQAEELAGYIRDTSRPDGTVVLIGDLNDIPGSPTYNTLSANLVDSYGVVGVQPGFTAYQQQSLDNPNNLANLRIDYVLARTPQVDESRVILDAMVSPCNLWPSDHFGVVSRFKTVANPLPAQPSGRTGTSR